MHVSIRAAVFMAEFYGLHGQAELTRGTASWLVLRSFYQLSRGREDRDSSRSQSTLIFHPAIFI